MNRRSKEFKLRVQKTLVLNFGNAEIVTHKPLYVWDINLRYPLLRIQVSFSNIFYSLYLLSLYIWQTALRPRHSAKWGPVNSFHLLPSAILSQYNNLNTQLSVSSIDTTILERISGYNDVSLYVVITSGCSVVHLQQTVLWFVTIINTYFLGHYFKQKWHHSWMPIAPFSANYFAVTVINT